MTEPGHPAGQADLAALQAGFRRMMLAVSICAIVGIVAIIAFFAAHQAWGLWVFLAALVSGFAAQVWFVAAIRRGAQN